MENAKRELLHHTGKQAHRTRWTFAALVLAALTLSVVDPAMSAYPKTIQFAGYEWYVKTSAGKVGPGPNLFSDSADNVWVDALGQLHLRITRRGSRWYCAEVISKVSFGHGTYRWYIVSPVGSLDQEAVLGLFTWNDDPAYNNREIDIEFARWGIAANQNAQYVVQPFDVAGNILRWNMPVQIAQSTHSFKWLPDSVAFQSVSGLFDIPPDPSYVLQQGIATNGIPPAGGENARANLWLYRGRKPSTNASVEVVMKSFEFVPAN